MVMETIEFFSSLDETKNSLFVACGASGTIITEYEIIMSDQGKIVGKYKVKAEEIIPKDKMDYSL